MDLTRLNQPMRIYPQEINFEDIVGNKDFLPVLIQEFGFRIARGTAAGWNGRFYEPVLREYLEKNPIEHAVEIGTWRGVTSCFLAHYAKKVTTIDIVFYDIAPRVWAWSGLRDKVNYVVVDGNEAKRQIIKTIDFDFAFIDGSHACEDVKIDFDCVKSCGRVLFHDYTKQCEGVIKAVDEIREGRKEINDPFAYWSIK